MFYEQRFDAPDSPETLETTYLEELGTILEGVDLENASETTGIEHSRLEQVTDGDAAALTLEEAAEIQSLGEGEPDAETIVTMACEHLLLGMTTAVVDVDTLAGDLEGDLDAKEVQQKIERRAPMTFEEFVEIQYAIAARTR